MALEVPATIGQEQSAPANLESFARFVGKTVIVTGASDRGIGGAIAERLAQEGARIAIVSRHEPKRLLKRLERRQTAALWLHCDITKTDEVKQAVNQSLAEFWSSRQATKMRGDAAACRDCYWNNQTELSLMIGSRRDEIVGYQRTSHSRPIPASLVRHVQRGAR